MKIYTKTGDKGKTSLFSGDRVEKHNLRIESYGTVDELNSHIGVVIDHSPKEADFTLLYKIQDRLFSIGSILATNPQKIKKNKDISRFHLPSIKEEDILQLEQSMDDMNSNLPEMTHFLLPGGHPAVSFCHVARCVCRRAERRITALHALEPVEDKLLQYINRLSDYLFVLSRYYTDLVQAKEVKWIPEKS